MTKPVQEYTPPRDASHRGFRLSQIERKTGGSWIYVLPEGDPDADNAHPDFQNGWGNLGGDWTPLRFRWLPDGQVEIEGAITGGAAGTVVFTLPTPLYLRQYDLLIPGVNSASNTLAVFQIGLNGDVTFVA